jgi:hypothetical protein
MRERRAKAAQAILGAVFRHPHPAADQARRSAAAKGLRIEVFPAQHRIGIARSPRMKPAVSWSRPAAASVVATGRARSARHD